jgi:hypothetical protein
MTLCYQEPGLSSILRMALSNNWQEAMCEDLRFSSKFVLQTVNFDTNVGAISLRTIKEVSWGCFRS